MQIDCRQGRSCTCVRACVGVPDNILLGQLSEKTKQCLLMLTNKSTHLSSYCSSPVIISFKQIRSPCSVSGLCIHATFLTAPVYLASQVAVSIQASACRCVQADCLPYCHANILLAASVLKVMLSSTKKNSTENWLWQAVFTTTQLIQSYEI